MTPSVLSRAKDLVDPALRFAVGSLDENLRLPSTYHLGWTDEHGAPATAGSGKGVRSALVLLGAEAAGGTAENAIIGAVAVELIHNFSLIHDDIMDNDRTRRHRATVWDVFGVGDAIIVGDALHALAFQVLLDDASNPLQVQATERLARATSAMIAGQAQDVALDRSDTATLAQCIAMEANKTGALLAQSAAIGGVLGGGSEATVAALEHYGMSLGIAFQAVDDVLGIWGDSAQTGKPVGNDLREQKKSMPIAIALERGGAIADAVIQSFAGGPLTETQIRDLSDALLQAGIRGEVEAVAREHLDAAIGALSKIELVGPPVTELTDVANFIAARTV